MSLSREMRMHDAVQSGECEAASAPVADGIMSREEIQCWHEGVDAFERGELMPADPIAADGWYYAENALAAQSILGRFAL